MATKSPVPLGRLEFDMPPIVGLPIVMTRGCREANRNVPLIIRSEVRPGSVS